MVLMDAIYLDGILIVLMVVFTCVIMSGVESITEEIMKLRKDIEQLTTRLEEDDDEEDA